MNNVPERLGKYIIRRELGRGAMGVVYEGHDPLIERTVAVKVLHVAEVDDTTATELRLRFRREAQAAGRLAHAHIVAVHDYGEDDGPTGAGHSAYLAMEFVKGTDLKRLFASGRRFTLAETGRIMGELLNALQHAHDLGVVHRDIKPGNIMLLENGSVKVADFGIAKFESSELTQAGSVLGTVSHMSPEQLLGLPVDRRSDLFSCGVVLYELLTGDRPFVGSTATVMQKVLHEGPLAPSMIVSSLPKAIDAVVQKAMAKNPDQRYATADDFASDLRAALTGTSPRDPEATLAWRPVSTAAGPPEAASGSKSKRSFGMAAAGAAALLVAGVGGWALLKSDASMESARSPASAATGAVVIAAPLPSPSAATRVSLPTSAAIAPPTAPGNVLGASDAAASRGVGPVSAPVAAAPSLPSAEEIERQAWNDALKADRAAAYQAYLSDYPKGRFASRARVRLATLAPQAAPAASPAPSAAVATAASSASVADCVGEARRNQPRCQVLLGHQYRNGKGVSRDLVEAVRWYRKAADQGDANGQHELAVMLDGGMGVTRDEAQATALFRKAADQGLARSQNRMGLAYERGNGVAVNLPVAAEWFRKAADQGQINAVANLARLYLRGRGVPKDVAKASEMLQRAAAQGEPNASYSLGWMHENGEGTQRDLRMAARYYREALANAGTMLNEQSRDTARTFLAANPKL